MSKDKETGIDYFNTLRELRLPFVNKFEDTEDGGLLVRDVRLLAPGYWTDSLSQQGTEYTLEAIKNAEWKDTALWSRHSGGAPRSIADKIGDVRNHRIDEKGVIGDLYFHRRTQLSRDIAEMTKAGLYNYVSSEMMTVESWNQKTGRYQTEKIIFTGVATVNKGACAICTITENSGENLMTKENEKGFEDLKKELEEKIGVFEKKVKELEDFKDHTSELEELKAKNKELEEKITELESGKRINELEKRIKELENTPAEPKTSDITEHELELPDNDIIVDRKTGEIYRM